MRRYVVAILFFGLVVFFSVTSLSAENLPIAASDESDGVELSEGNVSGEETIGKDDDEDASEADQTGMEAEIAPVKDTLQPFNRAMFVFNDKAFHYFFKPIYKGYNSMIPVQARVSVKNFYSI